MKKFLFILVLGVASCTKTTGFQEISVLPSGVQTGSLTKVDPSNVLSSTMPTKLPAIYLQSTSVSERKYSITNGESITVPIDTYTVSGVYSPTEEGSIRGGKIFSTPTYSVSGTIQVVEGKTNYYVPASYTCFALIQDTDVESYKTHNTAGSLFPIPWMSGEDVKVCYIQGNWDYPSLPVVAVPKDRVNYEEVSFGLVTDNNYEGVLVENGKWYSFSPNGVITNEGNIGVDFPQWGQGI